MVKTTANLKAKIILWRVLDIFLAFLPLLIYIIFNWKEYFEVISNTSKFKNIISLVFLFIFILVLVMKKEIFKGVIGIWIIVGLFYATRYVIKDIVPISLWVAVGYTLSYFITSPLVKKYKRLYEKTESAEINDYFQSKNTDKLVEAIAKTRGKL